MRARGGVVSASSVKLSITMVHQLKNIYTHIRSFMQPMEMGQSHPIRRVVPLLGQAGPAACLMRAAWEGYAA